MYMLTPGQAYDVSMAELLLQDLPWGASPLADRDYGAEWIKKTIEDRHCIPVIPPKSNRINQVPFARCAYQKHNLVEDCIGKLKQFRHIATDHNRKGLACLTLTKAAALCLWVRLYVPEA
jgi:transposase